MNQNSLKTEFRIIGKEQDSFIESFVGEPLAKVRQSGYFIMIVEVLNKLLEGEAIAESFSETFRKVYYSEEEAADPFTRFEQSLKELNKLTKQLEREEGLDLRKINIAVVALVNNELFVSQANDAEVYLNRQGSLNIISDSSAEGGSPDDDDVFSSISSGRLKDTDQVIISTSRLLRYAGTSQITRCISNKTIHNALADLNSEISTEVLGRIGVIGFAFENAKNKTTSIDAKKMFMAQATGLKKMFNSLNFIGDNKIAKKIGRRKKAVAHQEAPSRQKTGSPVRNSISLDQAGPKLKEMIKNIDITGVKQVLAGIVKLLIQNKKITGFILVSIMCLVILGSFQAGSIKEKRDLRDLISNAEAQLNEAKSQTDKQAAATILASIEEQLKPALNSRLSRNEASELLEEVNNIRFQFDDVVTIEEINLITDFNDISDYGDPLGFYKSNDRIFAYNEREIVEILLSGVKNPIKIANNSTIKDVAVLDDGAAYFLLDGPKIMEYKDNLAKQISTDSGSYKPAVAIAGFGSRLYALDNSSKQIWRYTKNRESFSGEEAYLDTTELPQSKDLSIDGSIYTITANNQINRFFTGEKENFKIENAPLLGPQNATRIRTDFDSNYVYVLDSAKSRILTYYKNQETKNLEYDKQYYFPNLVQITDFFIEEETKKLYLINKSEVYITTLD